MKCQLQCKFITQQHDHGIQYLHQRSVTSSTTKHQVETPVQFCSFSILFLFHLLFCYFLQEMFTISPELWTCVHIYVYTSNFSDGDSSMQWLSRLAHFPMDITSNGKLPKTESVIYDSEEFCGSFVYKYICVSICISTMQCHMYIFVC